MENLRSDVFYDCMRIADDEFCNIVDEAPVFFYGQVINDDPLGESPFDENKTYCHCPNCNDIFELDNPQNHSASILCPKCGQNGYLANFRDKSQPLSEMNEQDIAYMETTENGYVLRLFKAYADYSGRDYDDYTQLSYYPYLRFFEFGRECCINGCVKYYRNFQEDEFEEVDFIDDDGFWIINYDEMMGDCNYSPFVFDLSKDDLEKPLMDQLAKQLSFNAFRALKKYGFNNIAESMIFAADMFPDSSKISEVLGVDYNQIIAYVGTDITLDELLSARKLYELKVSPTVQNIRLMAQMREKEKIYGFNLTADNAKKTFKYLRNQENRQSDKHTGQDYMDYLRECTELGFDLNDPRVLYPTDLLKAHNKTSSLLKIKTDEITEIGVRKAYEKYHTSCSYEDGKFCVIMPQSCEEIIYEGKVQSHCVGGYVERVANGEDIILFIRRCSEKDKPFYTMEIRPIMQKLNIVQCRGFENQDKSPEIRAEVDAFLAKYEKWFNSRKHIVSDNFTRVYYKAVRKIDGKYISGWDNRTEYIPGQVLETETNTNPDLVAVKGIHIASLDFAQKYGDKWDDVAILELEVHIDDIIVPNAKDQIRASRVKVLREVPFEEMGVWGQKRKQKAA